LHPRVFAGNGHFLLAVDVVTGKPAPEFGNQGRVDLKKGVLGDLEDGPYEVQSPPAVFGDAVITGCSNGEGPPSAGPYGDIRGWARQLTTSMGRTGLGTASMGTRSWLWMCVPAKRNGTSNWSITTSGIMTWPRRRRCLTFVARGGSFRPWRRSRRWACCSCSTV